MKTPPFHRILQGFAFDPSFSTRLKTFSINQVLYKIRWEENLAQGPIGEYVEIVDIDPASNLWYTPIDLNDSYLLAQNGHSPSEGNPQFHQQMVYAAAMKTIQHFEDALGRKVIWYPRVTIKIRKNDVFEYQETYVPQLRLYPHAIRQSNAYYDPMRKAILFGYFQSSNQNKGGNFPGGTVFTCLSPDIVAHEVTHAILDSIHPRYIENSNPDVFAFHEAFADLVALFQRFTFTEIVEHQIAFGKGKLDNFTLLGELATQFGEAMGSHIGALRSAIGQYNEKGKWEKLKPDPSRYQTMKECHDLGAVLVAVVFDAFLRLYDYHTKDLIRIASNGVVEISNDSDLHPDLVKRLAFEACKIANRFLNIIIRAIDYCPPVDITFGDYLRALITADLDLVPSDENSYRIAIIESFRDWGIYPIGVSTLSIESLKWQEPSPVARSLFQDLNDEELKYKIDHFANLKDREQIHEIGKELKGEIHGKLWKVFNKNSAIKKTVEKCLGLSMRDSITVTWNKQKLKCKIKPFQIHSVQPTFRVGLNFTTLPQIIITIVQKCEVKVNRDLVKFRGGCTLIFDLSNLELNYAIVKRINNEERLVRQLGHMFGIEDSGVGDTYNLSKRGVFANIHSNS